MSPLIVTANVAIFFDKYNFYELLPIINIAKKLTGKIKYKLYLTFENLIDLRSCLRLL